GFGLPDKRGCMAAGLLAFFIALFGSLVLVVPVRALALRVGMVDLPGPRKVHLKPIPLLGGLAMYAAVVIAVLFAFNGPARAQIVGILIGATLVATVGILDDRGLLHHQVKLFVGMPLAAAILLVSGIRAQFFTVLLGGRSGDFLDAMLTVVWVVGITASFSIACAGSDPGRDDFRHHAGHDFPLAPGPAALRHSRERPRSSPAFKSWLWASRRRPYPVSARGNGRRRGRASELSFGTHGFPGWGHSRLHDFCRRCVSGARALRASDRQAFSRPVRLPFVSKSTLHSEYCLSRVLVIHIRFVILTARPLTHAMSSPTRVEREEGKFLAWLP